MYDPGMCNVVFNELSGGSMLTPIKNTENRENIGSDAFKINIANRSGKKKVGILRCFLLLHQPPLRASRRV